MTHFDASFHLVYDIQLFFEGKHTFLDKLTTNHNARKLVLLLGLLGRHDTSEGTKMRVQYVLTVTHTHADIPRVGNLNPRNSGLCNILCNHITIP